MVLTTSTPADLLVWRALGFIGSILRNRRQLRQVRQLIKAGDTWWTRNPATRGAVDGYKKVLKEDRRLRKVFEQEHPEAMAEAFRIAREEGVPYDVS